jgi:hypothetical protein
MQARIGESAIETVEAAGPDGKVRLLLKLNDLLLTDAEMEFVRGLGGEVIVDSARIVAVSIPGRHLRTLAAHLPTVVGIE